MLFITTSDYNVIMIPKLDELCEKLKKAAIRGTMYIEINESVGVAKLLDSQGHLKSVLSEDDYYIISFIFTMEDVKDKICIYSLINKLEEYKQYNNIFYNYKEHTVKSVERYVDKTELHPIAFIDYVRYLYYRPYFIDALGELKVAISNCDVIFIAPGVNEDEVLLVKSFSEPVGIIKGMTGVVLRKLAQIDPKKSDAENIKRIVPLFVDLAELIKFNYAKLAEYYYMFK